MITRRTLLASSVAVGGMAAVGAVLITNGYQSWVRRVLREALPGYSFDADGLDLFVAEYKPLQSDWIKFQLFGAAESVFHARSFLPEKKVRYVEDEERDVLTEFLVGSDFFQRSPDEAKHITYQGRAVVCRSPFAVFDL